MSADSGFVTQIAGALSRALTPLVDATRSATALGQLLARLGWSTPPGTQVVAAFAAAGTALDRLIADVRSGANAAELIADSTAAVQALGALSGVTAAGSVAPFNSAVFWQSLPEELFALLIAEDLETWSPRGYGVLMLLGVLSIERRPADPAVQRAAYDARVLDWAALGRCASSPATALAQAYGWGAGFDHERLFDALAALGAGLGGAVSRLPPRPALLSPYMSADNPQRGSARVLSISPFTVEGPTLSTMVKASVAVLPLPPKDAPASPPTGVLIWPIVSGAAAATIDLPPAATLALAGDFEASPLRIQLRPGDVQIEGASAAFSQSARVDIAPPTPFIIGGTAGGTRIELTRAHFGISAEYDGTSREVVIEAALDDASAVIDFSSADSFVRGAIGDARYVLSLAAGMRWSSLYGLSFSGSSELQVSIPTDIVIAGVLSISQIDIGISAGAHDSARLEIAVTGGLEIGPIGVVFESIGVEAVATPASLAAPGNFGAVDVAFGFKPPTGLGIGIDADGVVTGGGFISLDRAQGRYAGVVALQMLSVGLTAVGIVETKLRDDPDGWSLFLSVVADFTPVPLGFGFMLNGVGGFMGLHRTFDQDALAEGAREGRLDSLLFPEDPLADATRIIADVNAYFPTRSGTHAFGAMARIVWGVPTIVSAELGVIFTVPDFEIAIVGEIEALLPDRAAPLLELHMSVVGYADVAAGTFWIAASIYDSKLVGLHLSGDMAMYLTLGAEPYFVLSVGGFHPEWDVPALIPSSLRSLRRMSASVDLGESFQAGLDSYFAITSNTLQFGAEVWAVASARIVGVDFTAEGWFGFDVLIVFTPFSIVAGMDAGVVIKAEGETLLGVQLSLHLEGPKPWYATGRAEFRFLGFDVAFRVEVGNRVRGESQDSIDLWTALDPALRDPESWLAPALAQTVPEISLRALDAGVETGVWLAPDGAIEVRQHLVPLDREIELYGDLVPRGTTRFDVEAAGLGAGVEGAWSIVEDLFAPAQYTWLRPAERLAAPSFERMHAGAAIGASGHLAPGARADLASTDLEYEEVVLEAGQTTRLGTRAASAGAGKGVVRPARGALAPGARRTVAGVESLTVAPSRYTLVKPLTGAPAQAEGVIYADAVATRRALDAPSRIVPTHAVLS